MLPSYLARLALSLPRELAAPRVSPLDEVRLPMRIWPADIDPYLHLNNGRYLTLMDMGRYQWAIRTGTLALMLRRNWWPVLSGASIAFRRELRLFQRVDLVTRLRGWEGKWFWFEQSFQVEGSTYASAFLRGVFRHRGRTLPIVHVMEALGVREPSPPLPDPSLLWRGRPAPAAS